MTSSDQIFMRRALDLAALGKGTTSPNPMVGCVIVHNNKIIGESWHQQYGGPHAEVNAINSVKDKSLLPQSRLYVTLEPCFHYGKTPPCADLLIEYNVRDVVICNTDPNPLVSGRGIRKLLDAECRVHTGVLEKEGLALNKFFFTYHTKKRPYIILKWAETADGFIGRSDNQKLWISNALARKQVHKWRSEIQAIMVGTRTALVDNPQLNTREWTGKAPVRIVVDKQLKLPAHLHVFDKSQPTLVYNSQKHEEQENLHWIKVEADANLIPAILADLYQRNIQSVLVEGGSVVLNNFIQTGMWDEAFVFKSRTALNEAGIAAPMMHISPAQKTLMGSDQLFIYQNKEPEIK